MRRHSQQPWYTASSGGQGVWRHGGKRGKLSRLPIRFRPSQSLPPGAPAILMWLVSFFCTSSRFSSLRSRCTMPLQSRHSRHGGVSAGMQSAQPTADPAAHPQAAGSRQSCPPTSHPLIKPSTHQASMASCSTPAVQYWMRPLSHPHILAHPLEEQGRPHLLCRYWMARTICRKIWRASASL